MPPRELIETVPARASAMCRAIQFNNQLSMRAPLLQRARCLSPARARLERLPDVDGMKNRLRPLEWGLRLHRQGVDLPLQPAKPGMVVKVTPGRRPAPLHWCFQPFLHENAERVVGRIVAEMAARHEARCGKQRERFRLIGGRSRGANQREALGAGRASRCATILAPQAEARVRWARRRCASPPHSRRPRRAA